MLAIRYFLEYFHYYLLGRTFVARSDHEALKFLFSLKCPKGRVARWLEILSEYSFSVEYRKGASHGNADSLSRCPNPRECECSEVDMEENLKCGPCAKCRKRAMDMHSDWSLNMDNGAKVNEESSDNERNKTVYLSRVNRKVNISSMVRQQNVFLGCYLFIMLGICTFIGLYKQLGLNIKQWLGDSFKSCRQTSQSLFSKTRSLCFKQNYERLGIKKLFVILVHFLCRPWSKLGRGFYKSAKVITRSNLDMSDYAPWIECITPNKLKEMQLQDEDIKPLFLWLETCAKPSQQKVGVLSPSTRHYLCCWDELILKNGIIFRKFDKRDGSNSFLQLLTPHKLQKDVLLHMHNSILSGGHLGKKKTREKTLQRYYWFGIRDSVDKWVALCETCGANKPPTASLKAPLGTMTTGGPLDRLATDILGPFPETKRNNRYVLVCTDLFTKWVEIFAIPNQDAETTARVILNEVIGRFGCPLSIHSDQGSNYESRLFSELCELMEIRKTRTSVRNPKYNGQPERFNKTLVPMIQSYLRNQEDWDLNLGCLASAYRASPNETTGVSPNMLMLGKEVRMPAEIVFGSATVVGKDCVSSYGMYVERLKERLQNAHKIARKRLDVCAKRQKDYYDSQLQINKYKEGDVVWYLQVKRKEVVCPKLIPPYTSPFLIKKKLSEQNYLVQFSEEGREKVVHHDKLKPFKGLTMPRWIQNQREAQSN